MDPDSVTALVITVWAGIVILAGRGAWTMWTSTRPGATSTRPGATAPKGSHDDTLDHERRLLVVEAKQRALEMEWEDTRAKFLGMTRSFIRHAKQAGLSNGEDVSRETLNADPKGPAMKRADVLAVWRRKHAQP
jgi:hypothetical protein